MPRLHDREGNLVNAKIQFATFLAMPRMIYKACVATGTVSNTRYIQLAVCEALSRDLGIPLAELHEMLPPTYHPRLTNLGVEGKRRIGQGNTVEDVK